MRCDQEKRNRKKKRKRSLHGDVLRKITDELYAPIPKKPPPLSKATTAVLLSEFGVIVAWLGPSVHFTLVPSQIDL